jgi:hypothetical protein
MGRLGEPDRDTLYEATARASARLGREVQTTIRKPGWLTTGSGTFHDTVTSCRIVAVPHDRTNPQ